MVRHKRRWLLVRVETSATTPLSSDEPGESSLKEAKSFPTKKELNRLIRDTLTECFGLAANHAVNDTQVRFCDPTTRLAMIRTPREWYAVVRAVLCLITTFPLGSSNNRIFCCLRVSSVHGSTRTAKMAAIGILNATYRRKLALANRKQTDHLCLELHQHLEALQALE